MGRRDGSLVHQTPQVEVMKLRVWGKPTRAEITGQNRGEERAEHRKRTPEI